jgi:nucleoside-diphosphate-sugar epimerase
MILVTGGTGFVGAHLLLKLTARQQPIRALYRSNEKLATTKQWLSDQGFSDVKNAIEWVYGDLNDIPSLNDALCGASVIFHTAAHISFDAADEALMRKINIEGTANLVNVALALGVKQLIHFSSIAALGSQVHPNWPITEENEWDPALLHSDYAISKYGAEMEVQRGHFEGLITTVLNPGVIVGEGFYDQSSGSIIKKAAKGLYFYTDGSTGWVDINDVVTVAIKMYEQPQNGARYIVVGDNKSYHDFLTTLTQQLGVRSPSIAIPYWILKTGAILFESLAFFGICKARINRFTAQSLHSAETYSNQKVVDTYGISFTPIKETIERVCSDFLAAKN